MLSIQCTSPKCISMDYTRIEFPTGWTRCDERTTTKRRDHRWRLELRRYKLEIDVFKQPLWRRNHKTFAWDEPVTTSPVPNWYLTLQRNWSLTAVLITCYKKDWLKTKRTSLTTHQWGPRSYLAVENYWSLLLTSDMPSGKLTGRSSIKHFWGNPSNRSATAISIT